MIYEWSHYFECRYCHKEWDTDHNPCPACGVWNSVEPLECVVPKTDGGLSTSGIASDAEGK